MTSCNKACDSVDWFMGAKGECLNGTVCVCPQGFYGVDAWAEYNDCHVNIAIKQFVQTILTAINVFACVFISLQTINICYNWRDPTPRKPSSSTWHMGKHRMFGGTDRGDIVKTPVSAQTVSQRAIVQKRKGLQVLLAALLLMNAVMLLPYTLGAMRSQPILRYNTIYAVDIPLAMSFNSGFCAFWVLTYLNFRQLPGMELLGNMYGVKSIFVRRPSLVYKLMVGHVLVISAGNFFLLLLLPTIYFEDGEVRASLDRAWLTFAVATSLEYFLFFELVGLLLTRLLNEAIKSSMLDINKVTDWSKVFRGKRRLVALMISLPVIALLFWVPFVIQFLTRGQRYSYVTISVAASAMLIASCIGSQFNYIDFMQLHASRRRKSFLEAERINNRNLARP